LFWRTSFRRNVRVDSIICNGTQNSMAALLSSQKQFFLITQGKFHATFFLLML
jgi:hypothetical protein